MEAEINREEKVEMHARPDLRFAMLSLPSQRCIGVFSFWARLAWRWGGRCVVLSALQSGSWLPAHHTGQRQTQRPKRQSDQSEGHP